MPYFALIIMFYHVKIACYHLHGETLEESYMFKAALMGKINQ